MAQISAPVWTSSLSTKKFHAAAPPPLGSTFTLTIVRTPTPAASKTLTRYLSNDKAIRSENAKLARIRKENYHPKRRGGRMYGGRVPKIHLLRGTVGERGTVVATREILRGWKSIASFVEVDAEIVANSSEVWRQSVDSLQSETYGIKSRRQGRQESPQEQTRTLPMCLIKFPDPIELTGPMMGLFDSAQQNVHVSRADPALMIAPLTDEARCELEKDAKVFDDCQFQHFDPDDYQFEYWKPSQKLDANPGQKMGNLNSVIEQIKAPQAWNRTKGKGVTIAIVDTGIHPNTVEIGASRRLTALDAGGIFKGAHWQDVKGHGSMLRHYRRGQQGALQWGGAGGPCDLVPNQF